jgi:hypothetical protein
LLLHKCRENYDMKSNSMEGEYFDMQKVVMIIYALNNLVNKVTNSSSQS